MSKTSTYGHLKSSLTAAMQDAIRLYFAECKKHGRHPLTWDTASYAAEAAIAVLDREYPGNE